MAARPLVTVYSSESHGEKITSITLPTVFTAPIRPDIVNFVHTNMNKNMRQAHGVKREAGYGHSAESWGTGRAVARIPRVSGGGTHSAGSGAFGNMCRGGGMFAPLESWRRFHRKINITQKRHAIASALAASAVPSLVLARGHKIEEIPELPLVISNDVQNITKTKDAINMLQRVGCQPELTKVIDSKRIRTGKGKSRNRRYVMRRGPLVIYGEDKGIVRALRNIPGVDVACVDRLNLLQLAPGGSLGRLIIWTECAFKRLAALFGSYNAGSEVKTGYHLIRPNMLNADLNRVINSDEIQSEVRPARVGIRKTTTKKNPLRNRAILARLNPNALLKRSNATKSMIAGTRQYKLVQKRKQDSLVLKLKHNKASKGAFYSQSMGAFSEFENKQEV